MPISVVIPAFNEEDTITECLEHLLAQGPAVAEVIVVDNNSTDRTAAIVSDIIGSDSRVRLTQESRAGVSHARYAGFDAAATDIIASVDADTIVLPGWADSIEAMFTDHPEVGAGGAPMTMRDLPLQGFYTRVNRKLKKSAAASAAAGTPADLLAISGANSALRTAAWKQVRERVSYRRDIFEDLDLSLHLKALGHKIALVAGMNATVSGRRTKSGPVDFLRYAACGPRTFLLHRRPAMAVVGAAVIVPELIRHLIMLPLNRSWNHASQRFSLRTLRSSADDVRAAPVGSRLD